MMWLLFAFLAQTLAAPLQQSSLITLRTVQAPRAGGGNQPPPATYGPLILEEWGPSGLLQEWSPSCTLPGLSTELWTEGKLSARYPYQDQVWFLCRNVPANSSLSYSPAPVRYMGLNEEGILSTCVEDFLYPNGTTVLNLLPYTDDSQGINVFYLLGGGTLGSGPGNPARPAQARIRVDSALCAPADTEGALLTQTAGITINQLRILNGTLYGPGLSAGGSTGSPGPAIFQIGQEGVLPTGTRNPVTLIPNFPLVLSVWTDPFSSFWWRTGLNRTGYLARYDNSIGEDLIFPLPPSASAGTLGGVSWTIATGRQEGSDFAIYLTNTTHLVKNTFAGLQNGLPYTTILTAPPGWRYLSAHARNPTLPTPSATPTATASASATSTSSPSSSASSSATSASTPTPSASPQPTGSPSPSTSASASSYPSSTPTASRNPEISSEPSFSSTPASSGTPSASPSNGTNPLPPPNNAETSSTGLTPGEATGISLGSIAAVCIAGLLVLQLSPKARLLWTRQFGQSMGKPKKGVSFRSPVSQDAPITISHNPNVLVQQRLEQLKELQKQMSVKEITQGRTGQIDLNRVKKEFGPTVSGESV